MKKIYLFGALSVLTAVFFFSFVQISHAQNVVAEILARTWEQADPDAPAVFRRFLINNSSAPLPAPQINNNGSVLFSASLGGSGAFGSTDDGVWMTTDAGRLKVMRQGDDILPNINFWSAIMTHLKEDDDVSFLFADLSGASVEWGFNNQIITQTDSGGQTAIFQMGNVVPGFVPVSTLNNFVGIDPVIVTDWSTDSFAFLGNACYDSAHCPSGGVPNLVFAPGRDPALRIQTGVMAPGTTGANFLSFTAEKSGAGNLFYRGVLTGGDVVTQTIGGTPFTNANGIWRDTGNTTPQLIARTMAPLTSDPNGPMIGSMTARPVVEASNGDVFFAFSRYMRSTGAYLGDAVYRWRNGVLSSAIQNGDPIVGLPGVTFSSLQSNTPTSSLWAYDSGVVTVSKLAGSGVNSTNDNAIIRTENGQHTILARGGQQAVGAPAGQTYVSASSLHNVRVDPSGKYAFTSRLQGSGVLGTNNRGIWVGDVTTNTLELAIRQGITTMPFNSRNFFVYGFFNNGVDYQINARGDLLIEVDLVEVGDAWNTRYRGLVGYSTGRGAYIVAMVGQPLQTATGPTPRLQTLKIDTERALNDAGQIAAAVKFNNEGQYEYPQVEDEGVARFTIDETPSCPADFDENGSADVADIFAFLSAWFAGNLDADSNGNGSIAVDDIFAFLSDWFEGC